MRVVVVSEWGASEPLSVFTAHRIRARNICYAHALASSLKNVIGVTHNYFHDNAGGSEQGGQDYGLVPGNVSSDLSNGPGHPTFDAYNATSPAVWGQSDEHFCCEHWRSGCMSTFSYGTLDPLATAVGFPPSVSMHGWAWSTAAPKGGLAPVVVTIKIDGAEVLTVLANYSRPDLVAAGVAPSAGHGFVVGIPPAACRKMRHGKHTISATAALAAGGMPSSQHTDGSAPSTWELDDSPRCLCDFAPCECDVTA